MKLILMLLLALSLTAMAQEEEPKEIVPPPEALTRALQDPKAAQVLDLANQGLEQLPPDIQKLTELTSLSLNENHLSGLPDCLGSLSHLEVLWLAGNQVHGFACLPRLSALKNLDLARNGLAQVPVEITKLPHLEQLCLRENRILVIPPAFAKLDSLKVLDLSSNDLKTVPAEVKDLKGLKVLDLSNNPIPEAERDKLKESLPNVDVTF